MLAIDTTNAGIAYPTAIAGNAGLLKLGSNTLTFTGASTYSGGTTISAGTLQLGDGTAQNGSVQNDITNNGTLAFANPQPQTFGGVISGTGSLVKSGAGTLTLVGSSTYSGGTTVSAGTLQLGDGTAQNGSVPNDITNNGTLAFANPQSQAYGGAISGAGSLVKSGAGKLTLVGSNV